MRLEARGMCQALKKVDFLAVADIFMTPTAMLADIVLPAATYLEFDNIRINYDRAVVQAQQKVVEIESKSQLRRIGRQLEGGK